MANVCDVVLKTLANHFYQHDASQLFELLPEEECTAVTDAAIVQQSPSHFVLYNSSLLLSIHYSWLESVFKSCSKELWPWLLHCVDTRAVPRLEKLLDTRACPEPPPQFAMSTLVKKLYQQVLYESMTPKFALPAGSLNHLLDLSKDQLMELIDLLGFHDLANELRVVVDKNLVRKIYSLFTVKQRKFLNHCLRKKPVIASQGGALMDQVKSSANLKHLLHKKGLARFSMAMAGEHPSLLWYISRRLDTGRGSSFLKCASGNKQPRVTKALIPQVIEITSLYFQKDG